MKSRIYRNMILLSTISVLLVSAALSLVYYIQFSSRVSEELQRRAELFQGVSSVAIIEYVSEYKPVEMRISVVDNNGDVLFDSVAESVVLENHADREEIQKALSDGVGESKRFSDTLRQETYYYAIVLEDGYVLRVAKTTNSIWGMFGNVIPYVLIIVILMLAIGYLIAVRLTRRIIEPINKIDPTLDLASPYDELAPFILTINQQRERIDEQLYDLQNRSDTINAIINSMSEGVIILDKQSAILSVNSSALAVFDMDSGHEIIGKDVLALFRDRDVELIGHIELALSGNRSELNISHSGSAYQVYFSPVTDSGAIILFMDITQRIAAEKIRQEFSANVSHELKTPLANISGYAEMMANNMVKPNDIVSFSGKIKDETARLIALVEDIIMLSELDEKDGLSFAETVDLFAVAQEVAEALAMKADEKEIAVTIEGTETLVLGNRSMLFEMLFNICDNAIKYNQQGGSELVKLVVQMDDDFKTQVLT